MRRASARGPRNPARAAIAACALLLAWRCLTLGMADLTATTAPDIAVRWRAADPDAQYALAQADFLAHRDAAAIERARRILIADPLDGRGYRIAAAVADRAGDRARALPLFELAERRAPRDLPTRVKLATYALRSGDHERAIHEIDLLLRMQPELDPLIVGRLVRLTADPAALPALLRALSNRPSWRNQFLSSLATAAPDAGNALRLLDALTVADPPRTEEIQWRNGLRRTLAERARAGAMQVSDPARPVDWYDLMDWGAIDRSAYSYSEDPYDSVGMP